MRTENIGMLSAEAYEVVENKEGWGMANGEHPSRLKQGKETWNQWLEAHSEKRSDLAGADLLLANPRHALRMAAGQ
jgi:hypothetical protein